MTRTALRGTVALLTSAVLVCALLLAATALAAKPKKNAHFGGHTSAPAIEGFRAPVTFTVAPNGVGLNRFTFGSIGCFGSGGFRPGVSPYKGNSLIDAGKLRVPANGKFSDTALAGYTIAGQTTTTKITISGKFATPKSVSGTITFSQMVVGGGVNSECGPAKLTFSASAK
jgi:hypothetical protein